MLTRRHFLAQTAVAGVAAAVLRISHAKDAAVSPKNSIKTVKIPNTELVVSRIAYGCAGLAAFNKDPLTAEVIAKAERAVNAAYEAGITLFDHADLYGFGKSETAFAEVLKRQPGLRDKIVIQSKCGQGFPEGWKPGAPIRVNLDRDYIVNAVNGSLSRLNTDRLDILLLHAVDALFEPDEVAAAFDDLHRKGKVRHFGVSNFNGSKMALLQKSLRQKLVVDQIQLSLVHADAIIDGMAFTRQLSRGGTGDDAGAQGDGTLDYCRLNDIQVQAYSPLRGVVNPKPDASPEIKKIVEVLTELANKKDTTVGAVALAWLLRYPGGIVPVIGGSNPQHIAENCAGDRVELTRDEWYSLFAAATA